jgi:Fe(3+) dicitrate transport protein
MVDRRIVLASFALALVTTSARADEPAPAPKPKPKDDVTDVVVVGTKSSRLAGSAYVLRKDQLQRFANDDPHKIVLQVPGVYVRGEDGFGLRPNIGMRGANPDRSKKLTLMEDGVLFGPAPYSAPAAYYFPLMTRMETVRVFKGPGALVYGPQTVGGAIDFVTRPVPTTGAVAALELGSGSFAYRKADAVAGWGNERFGFLLQGTMLGSAGFKHVDGSNEDTGFARTELMAKGRFMPFADDKAANVFEIKLGWSEETSRETYLGLTDADFRADPYRRYAASAGDTMRWTRSQIELTHRARLARTLDVVTTFYTHSFARTWDRFQDLSFTSTADVLANPRSNRLGYDLLRGAVDSPTDAQAIVRGPNDRRFYATGIQTTLRWNPTIGPVANKIELGFRIHGDGITRLHTRTDLVAQGGRFVPAPRPSYVDADNDASAVATTLHLVDAITWKRFTVTPGMRIESIRSRNVDRLAGTTTSAHDLVLLPGISAFAGLTPDFGLLFGVHRGFSPAAPGDPAQNHESSINWEGGARFANKTFRADLIGFYNDYSNITAVCSESNGCLAQNLDRQLAGGAARIAGVEAFFEATPKLGAGLTLPMRASYTFTWAEFLSDFTAGDPTWGRVRAGDEMPYVPLHQLYAQLGIEGQRFGFNLAGTYVGDMRERPGQGDVTEAQLTDPYFLLDAGASWKPRRWLTVSLQAKNLLDAEYLVARLPFGARPGAPRTFIVGMRFEL